MRLLLLAALVPLGACAIAPVAPVAPAPTSDSALAAQEGTWSALATSLDGRAVRWATFGHGPRRVLWIGGIHGDEREGSVATAELPPAFLAESDAAERVTLVVIEDLNPDGSERHTRGNARGVDLNRNFPAATFRPSSRHGREPLSEPESRALAELVLGWRPELVLVAHSFRGDEFVNFDGPACELAERFAATSGLPVRESSALAPTPGSFGSWAGTTLGIPVLTLELRRGCDPTNAWERLRAALLAVLAA